MSAEQTVVSYLGPAGTFTEAALLRLAERGEFGSGKITQMPVNSPQQAVDAVCEGVADFAVVAIENFVDGFVTPTYDALDQGGEVQIFAEEAIEVSFTIMARPGTALTEIRTLATHPVAHQQIKNWMAAHVPNARFISASSNAAGAQLVAANGADAAAAPERAADLFGLEKLVDDVADVRGAKTRFVAVRKRLAPPARSGHDQTSVIFALPNTPGSLVRALNEFALRGVSLARIESRPTRKKFGTYRFYLDFIGHIEDLPVREALRALHLQAEDLVFLGSWPVARDDHHKDTWAEDIARLEKADDWVRAALEGEEY